MSDFTEQQKQYLAGFAVGSGLTQSLPRSTFAATLGLSAADMPNGGKAPHGDGSPVPAEQICYTAQDLQLAAGKKLTTEEKAKRTRFPLDQWDDIKAHAARAEPAKGTDILAFKYFGIFWVAPAQTSYMARLRFPAGIVQSYQLRGLADLADQYGGGFNDVTTRANLQIREIKPESTALFLEALADLGVVAKGSGADNIRNVTASALAGIDPDELYDTRQMARDMHHTILNHRELYGLPRKFNISFDGGGRIAALEDTNDIGFSAVKMKGGVEGGGEIQFRLTLGGITGHKDFARDNGVSLKPEDCVAAAVAIVKAFILHGDRTDRKKARLKYVLDRMGFDGFIAEVEKQYGKPFPRVALDQTEPRPAVHKHGHVGVHGQSQPGKSYIGVVLPVARMTSSQMRTISDLAERYGSRHVRLTVWQNLIIPDVANDHVSAVVAEIQRIGLAVDSSSVRAGLVACTGNAGCKFANANTKKHALIAADYLEQQLPDLDAAVNIHFTGCPNSCAQHFIGDIGLLGTKVTVGEDMVEGYHLFVGGGYGADQAIGRELKRNIVADDVPHVIESLLRGYLAERT
ncbi:MAG: sir 1, partial [Phycisphaerales bacterium]|nr:sir 1 [Phycisphaerales bacterium]